MPNKAIEDRCCLESESFKLDGKAKVVGNSSLQFEKVIELKLFIYFILNISVFLLGGGIMIYQR